jgi:hypothetical protein
LRGDRRVCAWRDRVGSIAFCEWVTWTEKAQAAYICRLAWRNGWTDTHEMNTLVITRESLATN